LSPDLVVEFESTRMTARTTRVEITTLAEPRHSWTAEQTRQIVVESLGSDQIANEVLSITDNALRASPDLPDFRERFRSRLEALARVQSPLSSLQQNEHVAFDDPKPARLKPTTLIL